MTNTADRLYLLGKKYLCRLLRQSIWIDKMNRFLIPMPDDVLSTPEAQARNAILFGVWLIALVFGVLLIWSILAPLNSAAIAPGKIVVDSNRKTISHYEGGIVEEILVSDGMVVEKNTPLLRLREVHAKAQVELLHSQLWNNLAIEARLIAERDDKEDIAFPDEIISRKENPEIRAIIDNQQSIFKSRTETLNGQLDILKTQIVKYEQEIEGLNAQQQATNRQINFLNEESKVVEQLLESGNAARPRLLGLKREAAEMVGRRGEYLSLKSKAQESISETRFSILKTQSEYRNGVLEELKETQQALSEVREKIASSADILERIVIRAPQRGIVNDLLAHTIDGVIKPGEKILDIVPLGDKMIVEARVSPLDIDVVRTDLPARVRLTAFKARKVPVLEGKVIFVSADQFNDQRTGESYFLARVEIDATELKSMQGVELYPGMPAEALIVTGSRSFMAYVMEPITDSFQHAFRQQ